MVLNDAPRSRACHGMMAGNVTGSATDRRALDAALRIAQRRQERHGHSREYPNR